jgi:colanic acid biosynthesis glycosyl transferase WcaI
MPWRRERRGRVEIVRTAGTRLSKRRLPLRMLNLGSYFMLAAVASGRIERPDLIVAATDPPLLGLLGACLKRRWDCPLVYNVRDLYPDIAYVNRGLRSRPLLKTLDYANRRAFAAADRIIVLGSDMRERIIARGVEPERVTVVTDWVDCAAIRPIESNSLRDSFGRKFVVMYSGNLGLSQQLETVIAAAERLRHDPRVLFVLTGEGARKPWLMSQASVRGLSNVRFLPYQPKERLAESLGAADLHLIPLMAGAAGCLVPSKVYGIMAASRPFVAMMDRNSEVARLAERHDIGWVVPPGDDAALAVTIERLASRPDDLMLMGLKARQLVLRCFDRKIVTRKFGEVLVEMGRLSLGPRRHSIAHQDLRKPREITALG